MGVDLQIQNFYFKHWLEHDTTSTKRGGDVPCPRLACDRRPCSDTAVCAQHPARQWPLVMSNIHFQSSVSATCFGSYGKGLYSVLTTTECEKF